MSAERAVTRIDLKTGFRCNNRCRFCVQGDKRLRHPDKDTAALAALLAEGRRGADEVVFTGGEVTLRRDLPELVGEARRLKYRVIQLQTNGRVLSSMKALTTLVRAGVTEVSPAIHGPNAETHDALTQVPGAFRQTVRGVRNATALGIPVLINSVITRANYRLLPAMARLFVALRVSQFQLAFVHALGSAAENFDEVVPRYRDAAGPVRLALRVGLEAGMRCMTEGIPLCQLSGYEHLAAEWIIPRTRIFDADHVIEDYTEFRLSQGKRRGPRCGSCRWERRCEGPWREYPERFGWDEFVPVAQR